MGNKGRNRRANRRRRKERRQEMIEKYCLELKDNTLLILDGSTLDGGTLVGGTLGYGFTDCEAEKIGKALRFNRSLEKVTLRGIEFNGVAAVRSLFHGIRKCRVKQVSVLYNFSDADKNECCFAAIRSPYIRDLDICLATYGIGTKAPDCVALFGAIEEKMPFLDALTISWFPDNFPMGSLVKGLKSTKTLKHFGLGHGKLTIDMMNALALGLNNNSSVTNLVLEGNRFVGSDIVSFFEAIRPNQKLEEISFGFPDGHVFSGLGPDEARQVVQATVDMPHVRVLILNNHVGTGLEGLRQIGTELPNLRLHELELRSPIDMGYPLAKDNEIITLRNAASNSLLQGMKRNNCIWKLSVREDCFDPDFYEELYFYTNRNRWSECLLVMENGLPPTIWCYLFAKRQSSTTGHLPSLIYYLLREQPNLVPIAGDYNSFAAAAQNAGVVEAHKARERGRKMIARGEGGSLPIAVPDSCRPPREEHLRQRPFAAAAQKASAVEAHMARECDQKTIARGEGGSLPFAVQDSCRPPREEHLRQRPFAAAAQKASAVEAHMARECDQKTIARGEGCSLPFAVQDSCRPPREERFGFLPHVVTSHDLYAIRTATGYVHPRQRRFAVAAQKAGVVEAHKARERDQKMIARGEGGSLPIAVPDSCRPPREEHLRQRPFAAAAQKASAVEAHMARVCDQKTIARGEGGSLPIAVPDSCRPPREEHLCQRPFAAAAQKASAVEAHMARVCDQKTIARGEGGSLPIAVQDSCRPPREERFGFLPHVVTSHDLYAIRTATGNVHPRQRRLAVAAQKAGVVEAHKARERDQKMFARGEGGSLPIAVPDSCQPPTEEQFLFLPRVGRGVAVRDASHDLSTVRTATGQVHLRKRPFSAAAQKARAVEAHKARERDNDCKKSRVGPEEISSVADTEISFN